MAEAQMHRDRAAEKRHRVPARAQGARRMVAPGGGNVLYQDEESGDVFGGEGRAEFFNPQPPEPTVSPSLVSTYGLN